jgi:methyltransferase
MELSAYLYLGLLGAVGAGRLMELRISRRNQRRLCELGAPKVKDPAYPWMVALHTSVLAGAGLEVTLLERPLVVPLAASAACVFAFANALRWWVICTLSGLWNVQVVASSGLGVVTDGPYRWIRHPNYLAVFAELAALPLIHTAWWTAALGTAAHVPILWKRIALEESVLLADPSYRAAMGERPRFVPRLWTRAKRGARLGG